jgi:hypothetical protein
LTAEAFVKNALVPLRLIIDAFVENNFTHEALVIDAFIKEELIPLRFPNEALTMEA